MSESAQSVRNRIGGANDAPSHYLVDRAVRALNLAVSYLF